MWTTGGAGEEGAGLDVRAAEEREGERLPEREGGLRPLPELLARLGRGSLDVSDFGVGHFFQLPAYFRTFFRRDAFNLSDCIPFLPFRPNHLQGLPRVTDFMQARMVLPAHVVDDASRKILEKV